MNPKLIDGWTFLHLLAGILFTLYLNLKGIDIIIILFIVVIWEMIEHSFVGELLFRWAGAKRKERLYNSLIDILIAIIGSIITYNLLLI